MNGLSPAERAALVDEIATAVADRLARRPLVVDRPELCRLLGLSESTIDRLAKEGDIPSFRVGRRVKFHPDAVIAALTTKPEEVA